MTLTSPSIERAFAARGWLSQQPTAFRERFLRLGRVVELERGTPVFHTGDDEGGVFGIVVGAIAVLGGTQWQEPVLAHIERAGDWFGHGPALRGGRRYLTFVAAEDSVLLHVPLHHLRSTMQSDLELVSRLAAMADLSTLTVVAMARDLLITDSARRVAAVLLRVTGRGEVSPDQPEGYLITQTQLGEMANLSRHQVNRVLGEMQKSRMIACHYNRIQVIDLQALIQFAYRDD